MSTTSDKVKEGIHDAAEKVKDVVHDIGVKTKDAAHDVGKKGRGRRTQGLREDQGCRARRRREDQGRRPLNLDSFPMRIVLDGCDGLTRISRGSHPDLALRFARFKRSSSQ